MFSFRVISLFIEINKDTHVMLVTYYFGILFNNFDNMYYLQLIYSLYSHTYNNIYKKTK